MEPLVVLGVLLLVLGAWSFAGLKRVQTAAKEPRLWRTPIPLNWRTATYCFFAGTLWSPLFAVLARLFMSEPWDFAGRHPWAADFYRWSYLVSWICILVWSLSFVRKNEFLSRLGVSTFFVVLLFSLVP